MGCLNGRLKTVMPSSALPNLPRLCVPAPRNLQGASVNFTDRITSQTLISFERLRVSPPASVMESLSDGLGAVPTNSRAQVACSLKSGV